MPSHSSILCVAFAMLLLIAGCSSESQQPYDSSRTFFAEENDARLPRQVADQQAMLGAQADPTLYSCHFDGNDLNALGRSKLDAIVAAAGPAVYVDTGQDASRAHRAAVSAYLAAAKVADGAVAIETGTAAPVSSSPAAPAMSRMMKTESPKAGSSGTSTSADNSSMPGTATGTRLFGD